MLWEAQFGDFVNSAQVIIDQFIVSALSKWGQTTRLTLLLPHGYEGSGPEHSSARLERFLILAAEGNIRVANLTTPAQYFHLLRRQARVAKQRPLVIMTPKSLLRMPQATSRIEHLSESRFFPVLSEPRIDEEKVTRLCSAPARSTTTSRATRRARTTRAWRSRASSCSTRSRSSRSSTRSRATRTCARSRGSRRSRATWAPARTCRRGCCTSCPRTLEFGYVGRPERASPGEGYPAAHTVEQTRIIRTALDLSVPVSVNPAKLPGER